MPWVVILKSYANLGFGGQAAQTHYRKAGEGPPLIMLHPSPLSSAFMIPLMELLEGMATVYAPDTPGYGQSDPLPEAPDDLDGYVAWLAQLLDALQLPRIGLYGSATGAQIAIQFARAHPEKLSYLVLENAVHFADEERDWILSEYFPSLEPAADGSHLARAWEMADSLFRRFPWFDDSEDAAVAGPNPPVSLVHGVAMGYLVAGADYDRAYRAAFMNERAENMQALEVPTYVIRWPGSILRPYADRLDDFDWPEHIQMVRCGPSPDERLAALQDLVSQLQRP